MMENKQPLVSVLISCFNVSHFINRGLRDVVNQSYNNIEIIAIDDGSSDDSYSLLQEWTKKDARISVIAHPENKGLGAARNTGIEAAKGKYIYFFDVDDSLKPDTIAYCVNEMETRQTDMMMFGFEAVEYNKPNVIDEVKFIETYAKSHREIYDCFVDRILLTRHGNGFAWNKFYRASFLHYNHLRFGNQLIQQDAPFNLRALLAASSIYISPFIGYRYFIYQSGNNGSRFIPERFNIIVDVRNHFESFMKNGDINDVRAIKSLNNSFWSGMMKYFIYDFGHKDCPYSSTVKKDCFKKTASHRYALLAAKEVLHSNYRIDEKALAAAVLIRNYTLFKVIHSSVKVVRKLLRK